MTSYNLRFCKRFALANDSHLYIITFIRKRSIAGRTVYVIETDALTFRYAQGEPNILENISMHIQGGAYVSVVGENGSGKSTLIRLFLGLLKPTSGTILSKARRTGYVPQKKDFLNSQFPLTVAEMLRFIPGAFGLEGQTRRDGKP